MQYSEFQQTRAKLFAKAYELGKNKHSETIKEIVGNRLEKYSLVSDIKYVCKEFNISNEHEALDFSDAYLTNSRCEDIERADIDRKISDAINPPNK